MPPDTPKDKPKRTYRKVTYIFQRNRAGEGQPDDWIDSVDTYKDTNAAAKGAEDFNEAGDFRTVTITRTFTIEIETVQKLKVIED